MGYNRAKIAYKPPIKGSKAMKTPYIMYRIGNRLRLDGINFALVHLYLLGRNNVSQEHYLKSEE